MHNHLTSGPKVLDPIEENITKNESSINRVLYRYLMVFYNSYLVTPYGKGQIITIGLDKPDQHDMESDEPFSNPYPHFPGTIFMAFLRARLLSVSPN